MRRSDMSNPQNKRPQTSKPVMRRPKVSVSRITLPRRHGMGDMGWEILQTGSTKTSCRDEDKETRLVNSICTSITTMVQILLCHGISQGLLS
jgi:hypothetical protein